MSYILDALKKSQQQKEQAEPSDVPMFLHSSTQQSQPEPASKWVWLIGSGLLIACFLFIWLIYQQVNQPQAPISNSEQATQQSPQPFVIPKKSVQKPNLPEPIKQAKPAKTPSVTNSPVMAKEVKVTPKTPAQAQEPVEQELDKKHQSNPPLTALKRVPRLEINSHIFSTQPSKRKVTINMREYQEGDWLSDELQLHEITPHGVRLKLGSWFIDVGRSQGWQPL